MNGLAALASGAQSNAGLVMSEETWLQHGRCLIYKVANDPPKASIQTPPSTPFAYMVVQCMDGNAGKHSLSSAIARAGSAILYMQLLGRLQSDGAQ